MTAYNRGDVVLVGFVFSDESGGKLRPALVISSSAYHRARQEAIVAAITSNIRRRLFGDHLIADWKGAGLLFPERKIGRMPKPDLEAVDRELRRALGL
jgi:mRNA interferase MazF